MVRRRPAAVIGALCLSIVMVGGPAASAQVTGPGPGARVEVSDLPVLSELPPLPVEGDSPQSEEGADSTSLGISGVQTVALALAGAALVAGALGLAVVTRRGRSVVGEERARPSDHAE
ncbi:hypothetical protein [Dietzia sp. PP-33]|jgi:hypothetical protein|uniref:hypothetical protein n=1 Tax=Dietzia sp. PP-33 TaxID=2957500 RepID=UPI00299FDF03|nr:hypothetical protein [Dietzia sp. PP-33]MDX2357880.1 hypothetical protein [Dietzia sp. PP-33]